MKVLWILGELPIPPDSGAKLRTFGLLKEMAPRHEVTAAVLDPGKGRESDLTELGRLCQGVEILPWRGRSGKPRLLFGAAAHLLSRLPFSVIKYCQAGTEQALVKLCSAPFDLIQSENIGFHRFLAAPSPAPKLLNTQNVEAHLWRQRALFSANPMLRLYFHSQARKMALYEHWLMSHYDFVTGVSEEDACAFQSEYGVRQVGVVPNAVDTGYFRPNGEPEAGLVLFSGALDYAPNDDGIRCFLKEIWPLVVGRRPRARLVIVGKNPGRALRRLAPRFRNVEITGWVEEVRPYLARANVVIAPLRMGGGSRLKILEAMAMAKPIVSTTIAAQGLKVKPEAHLVIADTAALFADKVISLLDSPESCRSLGERGRRFIEETYTWHLCAQRLQEAWQKVATLAAKRLPLEGGGSPAGFSPLKIKDEPN